MRRDDDLSSQPSLSGSKSVPASIVRLQVPSLAVSTSNGPREALVVESLIVTISDLQSVAVPVITTSLSWLPGWASVPETVAIWTEQAIPPPIFNQVD